MSFGHLIRIFLNSTFLSLSLILHCVLLAYFSIGSAMKSQKSSEITPLLAQGHCTCFALAYNTDLKAIKLVNKQEMGHRHKWINLYLCPEVYLCVMHRTVYVCTLSI